MKYIRSLRAAITAVDELYNFYVFNVKILKDRIGYGSNTRTLAGY